MRALFLVAVFVVGCGGTAASSAPQSNAVGSAAATAAPTGTVGTTTAPTSAPATTAPTAAPGTATPTVTSAPTAAPTVAPTRAPAPTAPPTPTVTTAPTPGARQPLRVVEFGFSEVSGPVYYGIIVENPNTEWAVFGTGVDITFLDGSGKELTSVGGLFGSLMPGQTAAIGENSFSGAGAKSMQVALVEGEWVPMAATPDPLSVSDVVTRTSGGQMTTTGTITSTLAQPLDFVVISVIYRDGAGKIIGGANDRTSIAAQGTVAFEIQALEPLPAKATEVYLSY